MASRRQNKAEEREILSSWKEISQYLGIAVRTAQRWESDLGLPVHRPEKFDKTYVIAFKDEIDAWLQQKTRTKSRKRLPRGVILLAAFTAGAALTMATLLLVLTGSPPQEISSFKVEKTHLVAYGKRGNRLWRKDLGPALDSAEYMST
ncbi:MAG: hypothetical protein JRI84_14100 [Deltaproteobacteria bacterium]|nr:hypothetical protein [Deltaproteobacteria bacterium]